MFAEAILAEEQTASADQALPVYLEMVDGEVSSRLQAGEEDDARTGGTLLSEIESLPLHLALTPPQMLGQVEVLSPVEMMEFQRDFAIYDDRTQMARFDRIQNVLTPSRCVEKDTCYSCGISISDFCEGTDDASIGE